MKKLKIEGQIIMINTLKHLEVKTGWFNTLVNTSNMKNKTKF